MSNLNCLPMLERMCRSTQIIRDVCITQNMATSPEVLSYP